MKLWRAEENVHSYDPHLDICKRRVCGQTYLPLELNRAIGSLEAQHNNAINKLSLSQQRSLIFFAGFTTLRGRLAKISTAISSVVVRKRS